MTPKRLRVLVAMSGGVDSSVAAALLHDDGYDVVGVTMQVWDYTQCDVDEGNGTCCSSTDVDDARAVADKVGFPFYVANCEAQFKKAVIDPFVNDYLSGETPLPCVNCNTFLKFDHLLQRMRELECDYLATGHYASIEKGADGVHRIRTSDDQLKDQTYFLFTLDPDILPKLIFPIGHLKKSEVRAIAEKKGLLNARKKDSVGICFVGKDGYEKFIESHANAEQFIPGWIRRTSDGARLARHDGIHRFTYGQRKGLGIVTQGSNQPPLFVVKLDKESGDVWVGEESELYASDAVVKEVRLLDQIRDGEILRVKIRYAHKGSPARVQKTDDNQIRLQFLEPVRSVTPGQAAVFYRENQLVGGGWL